MRQILWDVFLTVLVVVILLALLGLWLEWDTFRRLAGV